MAPVLADRADSADTHLIRLAEELQGLLVLRADLSVQVPQLVHQLVPLEGGRLVVRLQVLLAVGRQAVEAGLDGLQLLTHAEVAGDVARPGVDAVLGRVGVQVQAALLDLLGHHAQRGVGPQHGPLGEGDFTLRTDVYPCVVSFVPVAADAVHAETVATRDSHGVPEKAQAQAAAEVVCRSAVGHCDGLQTRTERWESARECRVRTRDSVECGCEPALKSVGQPARDRTYLYF